MAQPVAMGVPMGDTAGPGTQAMLDQCPGLLVQQKFDLSEIFCPACQKRNKYKITSDSGWNSDGVNDFTQSPFKQNPQIMKAKEESETCDRLCCQNFRTFQMYVRPGDSGDGPYMYKYDRPCKCSINCIFCLLNPQELTVYDQSDQVLGKVTQEYKCWETGCCLKFYWAVDDEAGARQFTYEDDLCCCRSCNILAPSLCCGQHHISVNDASGAKTDGHMRNIFPGCNFKGLAGGGGLRDSYHLKFPTGATEKQKALLMGGMFLIEYMMFEKNGNDDNGLALA